MSALDLTRPSNAHLAEALCHCSDDLDGHRLDAPNCGQIVTSGRYLRPEVTFGSWSTAPRGIPRGTCTVCARGGVRLAVVTVRTAPTGHELMPGVRLADVVELVAHRRPGRGGAPCAGRTAIETSYRFPRVDAMIRDYGPGSVTR